MWVGKEQAERGASSKLNKDKINVSRTGGRYSTRDRRQAGVWPAGTGRDMLYMASSLIVVCTLTSQT